MACEDANSKGGVFFYKMGSKGEFFFYKIDSEGEFFPLKFEEFFFIGMNIPQKVILYTPVFDIKLMSRYD